MLLWIDSDVPTPRWADTLRIEHLDATAMVLASRVAAGLDEDDWPLSIGAVSSDGEDVWLRLRLYPSDRTVNLAPSVAPLGSDGDEPLSTFAIDRLVRLSAPTGFGQWALTLDGRCMGAEADLNADTSCVAGDPGQAATEGLRLVDGRPASVQSTWSEVRPSPCTATLVEHAACIQGGLFFRGDVRLATLPCATGCEPVPERPAHIGPFYLDRAEVTVGRWRAALERGFTAGGDPPAGDDCTFDNSGIADAWPMNCVDWYSARAFCRWVGGDLPSEAQWEFAASGSGDENLYVWGNGEPTCDRTVYARAGGATRIGGADECSDAGRGPRPVMTDAAALDVTVHGVLDLSGNLAEWTLDAFVPYTTRCAGRERRNDPRCDEPDNPLRVLRGADWASPPSDLPVAHRRTACASGLGHTEGSCSLAGPEETVAFDARIGFRCAYAGAAP